MHEKIFNLGMSFAYPYESKYSIWRRFLSANQTMRLKAICETLGVKLNLQHDRDVAPEILFEHVTQFNYQGRCKPDHLDLFENAIPDLDSSRLERHCPECSESGFHADLYRFMWLPVCPIHAKAFESMCPKCKKTWPSWEEIDKRDCSCCGLIRVKNYHHKASIIPNDRFDVIEKLMQFVTAPPLSNDFLISSKKSDFCFRRSLDYSDPQFPSFQRYRHPANCDTLLNKLNIKSDVKIERQSIPLGSKRKTSYPHFSTETHSCRLDYVERRIRLSTLAKIRKCINSQTGQEHDLKLYYLPYLMPKDIVAGAEPCPYCLAFSCWFQEVNSWAFPKKYSALPYHLPEWLDQQRQASPRLWDFFASSGVHYETPLIVISKIYRKELEGSYIKYLNFFSRVKGDLHKPKSVPELRDILRKWGHESSSFFPLMFYRSQQEFVLLEQNSTQLTPEVFPYVEDANKICSSYESYLFDEKVYGEHKPASERSTLCQENLIETDFTHVFSKEVIVPSVILVDDFEEVPSDRELGLHMEF